MSGRGSWVVVMPRIDSPSARWRESVQTNDDGSHWTPHEETLDPPIST